MIFIDISFVFSRLETCMLVLKVPPSWIAEYSCTLEQLSWLSDTSTSDKCIICVLCNHLTVSASKNDTKRKSFNGVTVFLMNQILRININSIEYEKLVIVFLSMGCTSGVIT